MRESPVKLNIKHCSRCEGKFVPNVKSTVLCPLCCQEDRRKEYEAECHARKAECHARKTNPYPSQEEQIPRFNIPKRVSQQHLIDALLALPQDLLGLAITLLQYKSGVAFGKQKWGWTAHQTQGRIDQLKVRLKVESVVEMRRVYQNCLPDVFRVLKNQQ
jgi:hypothetical protein